jgi:hypothetical protein
MSANTIKMNTGQAMGGVSASKVGSMFSGTPGIVICSVIGISMFIGAFVSASQFVGSKDDWNKVQPQIQRVMILTLIGTIVLMAAVLLFFINDSAKAMYFILIACTLSLGLSYAALAIAAITR